MSYKNNIDANRDALFGGGGGGSGSGSGSGPSVKKKTASSSSSISKKSYPTNRGGGGGGGGSRTNAAASSLGSTATSLSQQIASSGGGGGFGDGGSSSGSRFGSKSQRKPLVTTLSGSAKMAKMKEAEEYREKAKKAMTKGLFQKPDPVRAGTYYRRAAEAYRVCGENRLERLHRIASGDCQMSQDAYSTAASEYIRAAELASISEDSTPRKQKEAYQLYKNAADAWIQTGENKGRVAECLMKAAFGLRIDVEEDTTFDKASLTAFEEAVEAHVPDVLNRQSSHRKTGTSALSYEQGMNASQLNEIALEEMTKGAYSHEVVQQCMIALAKGGAYESALYAQGAVCILLENGGFATVSLSRAYVTETILQLALGDIVAAERTFMDVHLQNTNYLSSRECKLSEDLIRAIKTYDQTELETVQQDRTLSSLHPEIRNLVQTLRVSGVAKKKTTTTKKQPTNSSVNPVLITNNKAPVQRGGAELEHKPRIKDSNEIARELEGEELAKQLQENYNELDDIMNDMGLDDEDEDDGDDDDDIDLR